MLIETTAIASNAPMRAAPPTPREIDTAREVQARLLLPRGPQMASLDYAGRCLQAHSVGGDTFDFLQSAPGRLVLALGDVSGKGLSAALMMATLHASLRAHFESPGADLAQVLQSVNQSFWEATAPRHFVSLCLAEFDDATGRLRYANCGNVPPILLHASGDWERLDSTSTVLGMFERWQCGVREIALSPGDMLVFYSDGVTENTDHAGEEFGELRLVDALYSLRSLPPSRLVERVLARCRRFGGDDQHDDMTLVVARMAGVPA